MFLWWRAWHHRNNIIFDKGDGSVDNSIRFLHNYHDTMQGIKNGGAPVSRKGKEKASPEFSTKLPNQGQEIGVQTFWTKLAEGWVKCNVDASFSACDSTGAWGAVLRDHNGLVIASAWDRIKHCKSALLGEAIACLEGINLSLAKSDLNLLIETDHASLLEVFKDDSMDRTEVSLIAKEFRLKKPPDQRVILSKISRICNSLLLIIFANLAVES